VKLLAKAATAPLLGAIALYRLMFSPLVGANCRHLPTCSDYAREAIETNGAWKGSWLTLARLCRCHPWGSHGFDPVPDLSGEHHPFAPWRYGRWRLNPGDAATETR
jgi:putative membrane protein insertion efficiency factor